MLLYHTNSWHYLLVLYVLGKNFFTENNDIDMDATTKANKIIWTRKPRVVNFCPYCRAIVLAVIIIPFVWIWRKLPHKPKKEKTHEEIMKNMKRKNIIIRSIAGGINIVLGVGKIFDGEYAIAAFQIGIGIILILLFQFAHWFLPPFRVLFKFLEKHWPKKKQKVKQQKPVKSPSLIKTYFTENHEKFCPAIAFVDPNDTETRV